MGYWLSRLEKEYETNRGKVSNRKPKREWMGSPMIVFWMWRNNIRLFLCYFVEIYWEVLWKASAQIAIIIGAVLIGLSISEGVLWKFYVGVLPIIVVFAVKTISRIKLFYYPDIYEYSKFVRDRWAKNGEKDGN